MEDKKKKECPFRVLNADEVEIRIGQLKKNFAQLLIYKNTRIDRKLLTEKYGEKWKSSYTRIGDQLYCTISVYNNEIKEWISREDCGVKSKQKDDNKFKSEASDAFKRAAFQFGIGEELYSFNKMFVKDCTTKNPEGNGYVLDKEHRYLEYLDVKEIEYDKDNEREIIKVVCEDKDHVVTFSKDNFYADIKEKKNKNNIKNIGFSVNDIIKCIDELEYNTLEDKELIAEKIKKKYDSINWRIKHKDEVVLIDDLLKLKKCVFNRIKDYLDGKEIV